MSELEFWFDFASPYAYLAAETIESAAGDAGVAVRWKPFVLGPIFQEQGWTDSPFNLFPAKGRYLWRDLQRETRRLGVPWRRPTRFPFNSALATKTATWIEPDERLPGRYSGPASPSAATRPPPRWCPPACAPPAWTTAPWSGPGPRTAA
ncbi:DSBA oxidoreductase, partial [Alcanivorax sp. 521-1]